MARSPNTLSTELQKIANSSTEPPVVAGWGAAFTQYMMESAVLGASPASADVLAAAEAAMETALGGISAPQLLPLPPAQKIVAVVKAYWLTALAAGAVVWITVPPLVPAPFTPPVAFLDSQAELAVAQALAAVFTANMAGSLPKAAAYGAIAAVLHTAGTGATVAQATIPSPTPGIPVG